MSLCTLLLVSNCDTQMADGNKSASNILLVQYHWAGPPSVVLAASLREDFSKRFFDGEV